MEVALSTYSKSASVTYESPSSRRFFTVKAKRLVRLARRVHDGRLFLPDIVSLLREAADELITLGGFLLLTEKGLELLTDLAWITSPAFAPEDLSWDIREKARHRAEPPERCTLCGVKLVWPAQIVWRRALRVVSVSQPIGIQCLTREAVRHGWGKLHHLITEVRALLDTVPAGRAQGLPHVPAPVAAAPAPTIAAPPPPAILELPLIYPGTHAALAS